MNSIPDVVLIDILSYLPTQSFLPICHVSKRFQKAWKELKCSQRENDYQKNCNTGVYETNPLAIGNLFESTWFQPNVHNDKSSHTHSTNNLNKTLLTYYIGNGFGCCNQDYDMTQNTLGSYLFENQNSKYNRLVLRKVMLETASRGDIEGMWFMSQQGYFLLNDEEICTMAGAAGHLEALKWLRGDKQITGMVNVCCPWNPTEVHREAAENSHGHVIDYVEKNCDGHDIQMHYGVGLPW